MEVPKTRISIEMPASAVQRLMRDWETKRPELMKAFKEAGLEIVGMEIPEKK